MMTKPPLPLSSAAQKQQRNVQKMQTQQIETNDEAEGPK